MEIKKLFDSNKDIYRTIEKVITYGISQEVRLKAEISEYIVTDSIEEQFEKLLIKMSAAMEAGGENEVGVWDSRSLNELWKSTTAVKFSLNLQKSERALLLGLC